MSQQMVDKKKDSTSTDISFVPTHTSFKIYQFSKHLLKTSFAHYSD